MNSKFVSKRNVNLKYFLRIFFLAFSIFSFHSVEAQTVSRTSLFNAFKSYIKPAPIGGTVPAFLPNFTNPISTNSTPPPTQTIITKQVVEPADVATALRTLLKQKEFVSQLQGPIGPQGEQGLQGLIGPQGPAGSAGSSTIIRPSGISSGATAFNATNLSSNHLSTGTGNITELTVKDSLTNTGTLSVTGATTLGALTTTTINGNTITTGTGTLTLAAGKTLTSSNTLTLAGTDGSSLNIGTGGTLGTNAYTSTAYAPLNSPTLITPDLGTPSAITLTNATGLPISTGISGLATGIATFLATPSSANLISTITDETGTGNLVFSTSPTLITPALGTPTALVLTNATGLPLTTGVTGILPVANGGTNASSASITAFNNITGYTAGGATGITSTNLVFSTSPNITTPTFTTSATFTGGGTITTTGATDLTLASNDSSNTGNVIIGGATSSTPDLLVVGRKTLTGNPTAVEGAVYYNVADTKFYIAEGSVPAWKEICNKTDAACGAGSGAAWNAITVPTGNLTLAMDADTTSFNYTATGALNPFTFTINNNAGASTTQNLLSLTNIASTQTIDINTESLLLLDNADTSGTGSTIVDNGILVTNSGGITSGITDALDASATEIDNAINIGANAIAGTNFSVTGAGAITALSYNGLTVTANGTNTLTIAAGKTLTALKTISFTSADDTGVYTLPTGTKTLLATDGSLSSLTGTISSTVLGNSSVFIGTTSVALNRGTGALTLAGITLTTPDIGTPSAGVLTNATGLPISTGLTGAGTGVLTALGVNVGSAGAFVTFNGALGTPSSGTATNLSGTAASLTAGAVTSIATHASTELSDTTNIARLDAANAFTNVGVNSFVGNVGVGTTGPSKTLDVYNTDGEALLVRSTATGASSNSRFRSARTNSSLTNSGGIIFEAPANTSGTAESASIYHYSNTTGADAGKVKGSLVFANNPGTAAFANVVRMVLQEDGDVGLGGTISDASNLAGSSLAIVSGNVGIGTTGPSYPLDVQAALSVLQLKSTTASNQAYFEANDGTNRLLAGINSDAGSALLTSGGLANSGVITTAGTNALQLGTNFAAAMTILSGGNVGIGTTVPGSKLAINGAVGTVTGISLGGASDSLTTSRYIGITRNADQTDLTANSGYSGIEFGPPAGTGEGYLAFHTHDLSVGSGERMRIDKSGNVGIGTTAPNTRLEILSANKTIASNQGILNINSTDSMAIDLGGSLSFGGSYSGTSATAWANISGRKENINDNNVAGYLAFATRPAGGSSTEWMRITSTGNVGIGTTAPAKLLYLQKDQNTETSQIITNTTSGTAAYSALWLSEESTISTKWGGLLHLNSGYTTNGVLQASGTYLDSGDTGGLWLGARNAAGKIHLYTGGIAAANERVTIDATGNVGIGTTNPAVNLAISSTVTNSSQWVKVLENNSATNWVQMGYFDSGYSTNGLNIANSAQLYSGSGATGGLVIRQYAAGPIIFATNADTEQMRIISAGNVGIGFSAPTGKLHVIGAGADPSLTHQAASTVSFGALNGVDLAMGQHTASPFAWWMQTRNSGSDGTSYPLSLNPLGGNVGIGTTAPGGVFEVSVTGNTNIWQKRTDTSASAVTNIIQKARGTPASPTVVAAEDGILDLANYGYDGANIIPAAAIRVNVDATPGTNDMPGRITFWTTPNDTASLVERFRINNAGDVWPGADNTQDFGSSSLHWDCVYYDATSLGTCASDERLKNNINDLTFGDNPLAQLTGLRPRTFAFNDNPLGTINYGFIAQEVQTVAPELVQLNENGFYAVKYGYIPYLTIKAIQEMNLNLEAIANTSTPVPGSNSETFMTAFFNNIYSKVGTWLADAGNGVAKIFTSEIDTKNLCVSDDSGAKTCITKSQLDALIYGAGSGSSGGGGSPTPDPTCTDGIQNQDETGVDTGGVCGEPTPPAEPSCTDGILNQDETEIDTGGVCAPAPETPPEEPAP